MTAVMENPNRFARVGAGACFSVFFVFASFILCLSLCCATRYCVTAHIPINRLPCIPLRRRLKSGESKAVKWLIAGQPVSSSGPPNWAWQSTGRSAESAWLIYSLLSLWHHACRLDHRGAGFTGCALFVGTDEDDWRWSWLAALLGHAGRHSRNSARRGGQSPGPAACEITILPRRCKGNGGAELGAIPSSQHAHFSGLRSTVEGSNGGIARRTSR